MKIAENKIENKRSVIKGFHRTVAVYRIGRGTQSPAGSQSPKDTRRDPRIAADCGSVMTSDQTVGSSSLSERAEYGYIELSVAEFSHFELHRSVVAMRP
jgi:hypothetical protein